MPKVDPIDAAFDVRRAAGMLPASYFPTDNLWAVDEQRFARYLHSASKGCPTRVAKRGAGVEAASNLGDDVIEKPVGAGVAVLRIEGLITKSAWWFGTTTTEIVAAANKLASDPDVTGVVVLVDSPGGSIDGAVEAVDALEALAAAKSVVVQVAGMAASLAYWLAAKAGPIFAGRMDLIGSIGTRMVVFDFSEWFKAEGIRAIAVDTGEFKSAGAMGTPITDRHIEHFQGLVNAAFAEFRETVVSGRGMNDEQFKAVSDGRIFTAAEAKTLGLIDEIRGLDATLAAVLAGEQQDDADPAPPQPTEESAMSEPNKKPDAATPTDPEKTASGVLKVSHGTTAETAATFDELTAALPTAADSFLVACQRDGKTVTQAKDAFIAAQADAIKAADKRAADAEAKAAKPGVAPVGGGANPAGEHGDAVEEFNQAVKAEMKASSVSRATAHRTVCKEQPELRERYDAAFVDQGTAVGAA